MNRKAIMSGLTIALLASCNSKGLSQGDINRYHGILPTMNFFHRGVKEIHRKVDYDGDGKPDLYISGNDGTEFVDITSDDYLKRPAWLGINAAKDLYRERKR